MYNVRYIIVIILYHLIFYRIGFSQTKTDSVENGKSDFNDKYTVSFFAGGGNKNYHDDSFYSMAFNFEGDLGIIHFGLEMEKLFNTEKGFESCFGEPERYEVSYQSTYIVPRIGFEFDYIGFELGGVSVEQTRGWCENILYGNGTFFYKLKLGLLDKYYLSIGISDNFRVSLSDELLELGFNYFFDEGFSKIRFETISSQEHWGFGLMVNKQFQESFLALGEVYFFDEIQITKSTTSTKVFNIRAGVGYLFGSN